MKKFVLIFFVLILSGCISSRKSKPFDENYFCTPRFSEKVTAYAQKVSVDIFWEIGLFRYVGENLYVLKGLENTAEETVMSEKICNPDNGNPFLGGRLYSTKENTIAVECLYKIMDTDRQRTDIGRLLSSAIGIRKEYYIDDGRFKILLVGDSLNLIKSARNGFKKLEPNVLVSYNGVKYQGPIYELSFNLTDSIYSFSYVNSPKNFEDYSLLQVDSSKLPLESPRYKELKKREGL